MVGKIAMLLYGVLYYLNSGICVSGARVLSLDYRLEFLFLRETLWRDDSLYAENELQVELEFVQ